MTRAVTTEWILIMTSYGTFSCPFPPSHLRVSRSGLGSRIPTPRTPLATSNVSTASSTTSRSTIPQRVRKRSLPSLLSASHFKHNDAHHSSPRAAYGLWPRVAALSSPRFRPLAITLQASTHCSVSCAPSAEGSSGSSHRGGFSSTWCVVAVQVVAPSLFNPLQCRPLAYA
ncbi:hypothetical protein DFH08DRAFT_314502 [Mycena albidolilacea]|uniref:Uncharacterized protein n=1 Tax=Mycena albidolilacea TaxID=1033008 RepID=A0AAD7EKW3_9AGAR|nr:hypothetical protein DFH08DRAFT_314502 [Mycena albidolilacea]